MNTDSDNQIKVLKEYFLTTVIVWHTKSENTNKMKTE